MIAMFSCSRVSVSAQCISDADSFKTAIGLFPPSMTYNEAMTSDYLTMMDDETTFDGAVGNVNITFTFDRKNHGFEKSIFVLNDRKIAKSLLHLLAKQYGKKISKNELTGYTKYEWEDAAYDIFLTEKNEERNSAGGKIDAYTELIIGKH